MRRPNSYQDLDTLEHDQQDFLLRQKQQDNNDDDVGLAFKPSTIGSTCDDDDEEEEDESSSREFLKQSLRLSQLRSHPDIRYIPGSRKEVHPDDPAFDEKLKKLTEKLVKYQSRQWQDRDSWEDSDTDSDEDEDERILVPISSRWLDICLDIWGAESVDDLVSKVKGTKCTFEIFTDSVLSKDGGDSGCGAVIGDSCHRPIVAASKIIPEIKSVSPFLLQLEGILLGIKLANKYNILPFYLYCPHEEVCGFVNECWDHRGNCYHGRQQIAVRSLCRACTRERMHPDNRKHHKKAFELVKNIISEFESLGVPWFNAIVSNGFSERNEAAHFLAKLKEDKEMRLREIGMTELWEVIYAHVMGHYLDDE